MRVSLCAMRVICSALIAVGLALVHPTNGIASETFTISNGVNSRKRQHWQRPPRQGQYVSISHRRKSTTAAFAPTKILSLQTQYRGTSTQAMGTIGDDVADGTIDVMATTPENTTNNSDKQLQMQELAEKCPTCYASLQEEGNTLSSSTSTTSSASLSSATANSSSSTDLLRTERRRYLTLAATTITAATLSYAWRFQHPTTALQLLTDMTRRSSPLSVVGRNGRPTVIEFWAPWCDNCRQLAPTMALLERQFADRINFISIDGASPSNLWLVQRFGVDAIPHVAFVTSRGSVETALIGPVPKRVLKANMDALLADATAADNETNTPFLPYVMYDAFRNRPDLKRIQFE